MKKTLLLYLLLPMTILVTACDYLDEEPYEWNSPEDVFSRENEYRKGIDMTYSYIKGGFDRIGAAFLDAATDDGDCTVQGGPIEMISRASITSSNPVENCWNNSYIGIRQALWAQKYLAETPLLINNYTEEQVLALKKVFDAELKALRALFEFDLLRHYGGYPIVDKWYEDTDDPELVSKTRDSFEDCVNHIVKLCDEAIPYLGVTPQGGDPQRGRMTRGAALAIKAKTLVYAASPLFNRSDNTNPLTGYTGGDRSQRWKDATKACADVMCLRTTGDIVYGMVNAGNTVYKLPAQLTDNNNNQLFVNQAQIYNEWIVMKTASKDLLLERRQFPPSLTAPANENQGGGTVPTLELFEAFTMADGSDYTTAIDGSPVYAGRDARFEVFIGRDQSQYGQAARTVNIASGADETIDAINNTRNRSTTTGFYLGKFVNKTTNVTANNPAAQLHVYPIIRLADIILFYAEAVANGWGDISADPLGVGLSAKDAVGMIRTRAKFPATDKYLDGVTTVEQFMAKLKQERRVELCFEEARYFDLRRWLDAEEVLSRPIHGLRVVLDNGVRTYEKFVVDDSRRFPSNMYLHPIPLTAIRKSPQIEQNPGW